MEARASGIKVGLIRPRTIWPFPSEQIARTAEQVDTIVVAEMNLGQMIGEVERAVQGKAEIVGHLRSDGEPMTPADLLALIASVDADREQP